MVSVTGWKFSNIWWVCWKSEGATFYCEWQRVSRKKTERRFGTRQKVQEKNGKRGEDRRNKHEDEKKGFEFSRDEIVKSDEKVTVKLLKLKITKFEDQP